MNGVRKSIQEMLDDAVKQRVKEILDDELEDIITVIVEDNLGVTSNEVKDIAVELITENWTIGRQRKRSDLRDIVSEVLDNPEFNR